MNNPWYWASRPTSTPFVLPTITSGNYLLWVDTKNSVITLNSGNVSSITDLSGNGRNLLQGTAANQPAYSATGWDGTNSTMTFDGVNDNIFTSTNFPQTGNFAATTFIVYQPSSITDNSVFSWGDSGTTLGNYGHYLTGTNIRISYAGGNDWISNAAMSTSKQILTFTKGTGAINTTSGLRVNAVTKGQSSSPSTTPNVVASPFRLGEWGTVPTYFAGKISAIVVCDAVLNGTDIATIETALNGLFPTY